jgi:hypothetical protein
MTASSTSVLLALALCVPPSPTAVSAEPTGVEASASEPRGERARPPGHPMVVAGVVLVVSSVVGYAIMAAGLGIGNRAEQDVASLTGPDDIERRREVLERGRLGNRMAIGAGVSSAALMAVGLPLVFVGRRRAQRSLSESRVSFSPLRGGAGLSWRVRF